MKYRGFMYKQLSCEDSLIDFIESKHPEVQSASDTCSFSINVNQIRNKTHLIFKIPDSCFNEIRVYFPAGGTQTDIFLYNEIDELKERISFSFENQNKYLVFKDADKGTYVVNYNPCHWRSEFKITIE